MIEYYFINGAFKFMEEDDPEKGCLPGTAMDFSIVWQAKDENLVELLKYLAEMFCAGDKDAISLNACDKPGRVDICVMEDANGVLADENDIHLWKQRKRKLYSVIYTFYIECAKPIIIAQDTIDEFMDS